MFLIKNYALINKLNIQMLIKLNDYKQISFLSHLILVICIKPVFILKNFKLLNYYQFSKSVNEIGFHES